MYLNTARTPPVSLRENVTGDDSAITVFKRSNWPSSNIIKLSDPPLQDANGLVISAFGTDTENDTLTGYKLLGIPRQDGPIYTLFAGAMTLGSLVATTHPIGGGTVTNGLWVDSITVTGGFLDGQHDILDHGNNRIAGLKFDKMFFDQLYLEIDTNNINAFYAFIIGY